MMSLAWHVMGASVQGSAHQEADALCQDAHLYRVLPQGDLLVAVADGAGSACRSHEGAGLAVDRVIAGLAAELKVRSPREAGDWRTAIVGAFLGARDALARLARREDVPISAFATTLTCLVACTDRLAVGQIGDGAAVVKNTVGAWHVVARPHQGEYANESFFLTMPDALNHIVVDTYHQPVQALAVTTDGLLRLAMELPGYRPHLPFFEPLIAFAAEAGDERAARDQLAAFLASDRVCARTDDDKTLVVAARTGNPRGWSSLHGKSDRHGERGAGDDDALV